MKEAEAEQLRAETSELGGGERAAARLAAMETYLRPGRGRRRRIIGNLRTARQVERFEKIMAANTRSQCVADPRSHHRHLRPRMAVSMKQQHSFLSGGSRASAGRPRCSSCRCRPAFPKTSGDLGLYRGGESRSRTSAIKIGDPPE